MVATSQTEVGLDNPQHCPWALRAHCIKLCVLRPPTAGDILRNIRHRHVETCGGRGTAWTCIPFIEFSGVQRPQLVSPEAADFVQMVLGREAGGPGVSLQTWIVGV